MDHINWFIENGSVMITIQADIFTADGGDSVVPPSLQHVASQAPVLSVRAELQDLVSIVPITIATWI